MRLSKYFLPTLKNEPSDSEIVSHSLSIRAGIVRKVASGIYSFLPLGYKVLKKIENIVREEMDKTGALEVLMPVIQPSELWQESNRWSEYGPEMFKITDRNNRDFCLGPTHEELFTTIIGSELTSYKDLPINLYQIQTKFRDEIRPRYGLLRSREFIMKDAYSFGSNEQELDYDYNKMYETYCAIIERIGLRYKVVEADTGLIGGEFSHEFMILAKNGEEIIVYCEKCGYASNINNANFLIDNKKYDVKLEKHLEKHSNLIDKNRLEEIFTPGIKTIDDLASFLKISPSNIIKSILLKDRHDNFYCFLISGERTLNLNKVQKFLKTQLEFVNDENNIYNLPLGFIGPINIDKNVDLYADFSIFKRRNLVAGAGKTNYHILNVDSQKDFKVKEWGNFTYPIAGDLCENCKSVLNYDKGIEVGHIFKLGTKYSEKLNSKFLDKDGTLKPFVMGCYGIGITRMLSAIIEQCHDEKGIIWPKNVSPFNAVIIVTNTSDNVLKEAGDNVYNILIKNSVDVLYDDREVSAGIKFKDSDLIGIPLKIIVGKKYLMNNKIEIEHRDSSKKAELDLTKLIDYIKSY